MIRATTWINPEILKWARERIGLSPAAVEEQSKKLGRGFSPITARQLEYWESGSQEPDLEYLETLAEVYVCPVGYFFLRESPREAIPLNFRGLSSEKQGNLRPLSQQTLYRFLELVEWTTYLIEEGKQKWNVKISRARHVSADLTSVNNLVDQERKRLGFGPEVRRRWRDTEEAFLWWRKRIEEQGVFCFQMKLETSDIRGASVWFASGYPFILVNHQDVESASGRIFTLLHEYAHIISGGEGFVCDFRGFQPSQTPEPFANRFAARMLLSYDELKAALKEIGRYEYSERWPESLLDQLKSSLFVSRDVIAIALQEMNLAPSDFYSNKLAQWEKKRPFGRGGGGKRPTNNVLKFREIGYSLTRILSRTTEQGSIALDDLSAVLGMKVEKIPAFVSWARSEVSEER
jgi:Zn-dependent peptidase ImmA (M78 family)